MRWSQSIGFQIQFGSRSCRRHAKNWRYKGYVQGFMAQPFKGRAFHRYIFRYIRMGKESIGSRLRGSTSTRYFIYTPKQFLDTYEIAYLIYHHLNDKTFGRKNFNFSVSWTRFFDVWIMTGRFGYWVCFLRKSQASRGRKEVQRHWIQARHGTGQERVETKKKHETDTIT